MRKALKTFGKRLRTADRLTALMLSTSLLLVIVAGLAAWVVRRAQSVSEAALSSNVQSVRAAVELELHSQELRDQIDRYAPLDEAETPPGPTDVESMSVRREQIEHWLDRTRATAHSEQETLYVNRIRAGLTEFFELVDQLSPNMPPEASGELARSAEIVLEEEVLAPAREYLLLDETLLEASRQDAANQSERLAFALLSLGIVGAFAASIAGYSLARSISHSLLELRIPMQRVAGKLSEVAGEVVVSTKLDLDDLGPALALVSSEVSAVVEELQRRHEEILRAERLAAMGQLAAGLAHEIRNPLTAMKMLIQTTRHGDATLEPQDLAILDEEIRRLETLMEEFLDFARPRPLTKSVVDVRVAVEGAVAAVQRLADARGVQIECRLPAEPVLVPLDSGRMRQVLLNLLMNGIEETAQGKTVKAVVHADASGNSVQIAIEDDGPGIDEVAEPRLFEPFFSTKETGLGLGLPMSRRIVESHGGTLSATSSSDGSTFLVTLPTSGD